MSRNLTSGMVTALTAGTLRPFFLFQGEFLSSTLCLWDGYGDLSWNGLTWLGNGWFRGQSDLTEDGEIKSDGVDINLNGVPSALVSLILTEATHASRGSIWMGCFDSAGSIVADPYLLFTGALSAPRINDSNDTADIVLSYEDDLIMLNRTKELRYNHESQQSLFPGDLGFIYVAGLANWTGFWGNKTDPRKVDKGKKDKGRKKKQDRRR